MSTYTQLLHYAHVLVHNSQSCASAIAIQLHSNICNSLAGCDHLKPVQPELTNSYFALCNLI